MQINNNCQTYDEKIVSESTKKIIEKESNYKEDNDYKSDDSDFEKQHQNRGYSDSNNEMLYSISNPNPIKEPTKIASFDKYLQEENEDLFSCNSGDFFTYGVNDKSKSSIFLNSMLD